MVMKAHFVISNFILHLLQDLSELDCFLQHAIQMATIQRQDTAKGMFYTLQPRAEPIDRNMPTPK